MSVVRIGIVAGEASGDLLGSHLVAALKARLPDVEFVGIGGPKMIAAGVKSLFPLETLAVRGYVEALRSLPAILGIRKALKRYFRANPPHLFIGVDAPDFNLGLERKLKQAGIPTFQYVGPSIWAWRGGRMGKIKRAVSHMLLLFPFEKQIYDAAGVAATYVGHPLADMLPLTPDRDGLREQLKLRPADEVVALLPGSRQSELKALADLFVQTAKLIARTRPNTVFLAPLITKETRQLFEAALYRHEAYDLPIRILFGHAHDAMVAANVVLVASGTATLEAALLKRPMVITYRVPKLTYKLMWPRRYLPYVGLPNVLAGRFVVPELLQQDATAENLAQAVCNLLGDKTVVQALEQEFTRMHQLLRQSNAEKAAGAILAFLREQGRA
jgi:lipid-A-disaccharide synthase